MSRRRPLLGFFLWYRRFPLQVLGFVVLVLVANATLPLNQHFFGKGVDEIISADASGFTFTGLDGLWFWVWMLVLFSLVRGVVSYLATIAGMILGQRLMYRLRNEIMERIQVMDAAYHDRHGAGELVSRTTRDVDKVQEAVVIATRMLVEVGLFLVALGVFLFAYHWSLGLIAFTSLGIAAWLMAWSSETLVRLDRHSADRYDALTQELTEGVAGVRVVKAFRLEDERVRRFDRYLHRFARANLKAESFGLIRLSIPQFLVAMGNVGILWWGIYLVGMGLIPLGILVSAAMLATAMVFRLDGVARALMMFAEARAGAARLQEVMEAQPGITGGNQQLPDGPLGLHFGSVSLVRGEKEILSGIDIDIPAGQVVAVVGPTGCGKSSLLDLLPRFRDPAKGSVAVVGRGSRAPLPDLALESLRMGVQRVPQESFLFTDTVIENIRLSRPDATEDEVWAALDAAGAGFVRDLDDQLATIVGEKGLTLSGGQRQRLCLARALVANPRVLVLDDATSAIDNATEAAIHQSLERLATGELTVVMATSRLSTVLLADRVLMLDNGHVAADGTHEELSQLPAYRELLGLDAAEGAA